MPNRPIVEQYEVPKETEFIQITPTLNLPSEAPGYTLILPKDSITGLAIMFHSGRDTSHAGYEMRFYQPATQKRIGVMYVSTGNPFEFLFDSSRLYQLDSFIEKVLIQHPISRDNLLFAGMSLAGTRALKYALWCLEGNSPNHIKPRAIAICDAPLDFQRFWYDSKKAVAYNTNPTSVNEAKWVTYQLERNLGGSPVEVPEAYTKYSPYAKLWNVNPNAHLLKGVAIRAYTEPDIQWWTANRKKDYYGMNALDAALLINDLQIIGHSQSELITTSGKGMHPDGRRHPHSWSIVNNVELVEWFLDLK